MIGILILAALAQGEGVAEWAEALKSDRIETRDDAARKLIEAGESARATVAALADGGDLETRSRAREILRRIDARREVRGRKVLIDFHGYPVGEVKVDNTRAHDQAARDIQDALANAGVKTLQVVYDSRKTPQPHEDPKKGMIHFAQRILVDCGDRAPEDGLKALPHRQGAIVFQDGAPVGTLPALQRHQRGASPRFFGSMRHGSTEGERWRKDFDRFRAILGVNVVHREPPGNTFGSNGILQLTPDAGVTLLEVFLLTQAEFYYGNGWWEVERK